MKQTLLLLLFASLFFVESHGQNFTISGTIKDASNGEDLFGSFLSIKELPGKGTTANAYGFYSLALPKGEYTLVYQYIGYNAIEKKIVLDKDIVENINLITASTNLSEVTVTSEKQDRNVTSNEIGVFKMDPKQIASVPVLFGEKDVMKTLQLTPGVKSAGEGSAGFFVRGGGADQNLILLDEAPVYNASHLLGFFSVFNSDALKDVTLYKGGIPAEYGGRVSSVMDIKMKDGNNKKLAVSGGIGLISSRLTIEAPIKKEKGSFVISARRTYADLFLKLSNKDNLKKSVLYFYDFNLKSNYQVTTKDRVFLSGYFGKDVLGFNGANAFGFNWGNATGTLRWNHIFNSKLFSNTSAIFSNYNYNLSFGKDESKIQVTSSIQDINLKQDYSYFLNSNNKFKLGFNLIHHTFKPGQVKAGTNSGLNNKTLNTYSAIEGALYIQNEQNLTSKLSIQYGLRYSFFDYMASGKIITYDKNGTETSEKTYNGVQSVKIYGGIEPRLAGKYQLSSVSSIKAGYNRNYQYLHLLSNSTLSSPTDLWVPTSNNVKPQIGDQVSLGYFRNFKENMFEFSFETYYKNIQNQIDYKNGAQLVLNGNVEKELVYGKGKAYGAEFFLRKQKGKLTGWVSYTLSRSLRKFDDINNGNYFSARQDKIHDIAIVAMYDLTKKIKVSANWVYSTGAAVTFPVGKYQVDGFTAPYYTSRNGYRMPNYHRLDLGLTWEIRKTENRESSLNFSIYNAYARQNAYSITFQQNKDDPTKTEAVQTSLFRIVPSVTYNFKF